MKYILDIGCGTGYRTYQLSKSKDVAVTGIDISEDSISVAKSRYTGVNFVCVSGEKLPFDAHKFDAIYATDVFEHVDNLDLVLNEVTRVLKPGGMLFIVVPNDVSELWLLKLRPTYHQEIHHVRIFKDGDLESMLQTKGFKLVKLTRKNFMQHFELYYFFKTQRATATQLEIGKWDSNILNKAVHGISLLFDPYWVFNTPLKYFPLWIVTLPLGFVINYFGNKVMPKSMCYEFEKATD